MHQKTQECRGDLKWWLNNLRLNKGKPISIHEPDLIIPSDGAKSGEPTVRVLLQEEIGSRRRQKLHINNLELQATKLALMTFTKLKEGKTVHL